MKSEIRTLTVEKQRSTQWCWISASFAVIRYYRFVVYDQDAVAYQVGVTANLTGSPATLLKEYGIFQEQVSYSAEADDDISAEHRASNLFTRVAMATRQGLPVIVGVKSTGGGGMLTITFAHALVVKAVDDIHKTITFLDPGRPRVELTASARDLAAGWQIYPNTPHAHVEVYAHRLFFSKAPHVDTKTVGNVINRRR